MFSKIIDKIRFYEITKPKICFPVKDLRNLEVNLTLSVLVGSFYQIILEYLNIM